MRLAWLIIVAFIVVPTAAVEAGDRPNILYILADDVGCETLGCYGGTSYQTPHLDRLAESGMRFRHCYSMPVCHPTRICLLTGRYPFRLDHPRWGSFPKSVEEQTLAHVLKRAGYATAVAGKWQLTMLGRDLDHPHRLGFDEYSLFGWHEGPRYYQPLVWQNGKARDDVKDRYGPEVYADFLIDFIERHKDGPFFAFYSMALCHDVTDDLKEPVPYGPGKDRYDSFHEMIEAMDVQVGRLVKALDRIGIRKNTVIIYTTDNGTPTSALVRAEGGKYVREPFVSNLGDKAVRGGKGSLTNAGTNVPLIVNWPGNVAAGQVVDDLVDFSDFLPTFAELGGGEPPGGVKLDGHSFAPRLRGSTDAPRGWAFSEGKGKYWVRTARWKLYSDGRFFDVVQDDQEKRPLNASELNGDAQATYEKLLAAQRSLEN